MCESSLLDLWIRTGYSEGFRLWASLLAYDLTCLQEIDPEDFGMGVCFLLDLYEDARYSSDDLGTDEHH